MPFQKPLLAAPLRGPARNHRLRSLSCRMKLRFISALLHPCTLGSAPQRFLLLRRAEGPGKAIHGLPVKRFRAPPMAPHSFGRLYPPRYSSFSVGSRKTSLARLRWLIVNKISLKQTVGRISQRRNPTTTLRFQAFNRATTQPQPTAPEYDPAPRDWTGHPGCRLSWSR